MSSSDVGIDLSEMFGPIYWGFFISLFLAGVTCVQAYLYFPTSTDRAFVKITAVAMLFVSELVSVGETDCFRVLDIVSSALIAQSIFYYLLPHFGSLEPLSNVTPEISAECLLSTIITLISQIYFVRQLYIVRDLVKFKSSWLLLGVISLLAFLAFAGGVACVASMYLFHHGVLSNRNHIFEIFFGVAKGFGALTDIVATIAMSFFLESSRTEILQTNKLINNLLFFIVQRGILVTLIQILLLITFYAFPERLYWFAIHINVTKLYANTFFAMLNGRNYLKNPHMVSRSKSNHFQLMNLEGQSVQDKDNALAMPRVTKTVTIISDDDL